MLQDFFSRTKADIRGSMNRKTRTPENKGYCNGKYLPTSYSGCEARTYVSFKIEGVNYLCSLNEFMINVKNNFEADAYDMKPSTLELNPETLTKMQQTEIKNFLEHTMLENKVVSMSSLIISFNYCHSKHA